MKKRLPGISTKHGLARLGTEPHIITWQPSWRKRVPSEGKASIDFTSLWFLACLYHVGVGTLFVIHGLTILLQYPADLKLSVVQVCLH